MHNSILSRVFGFTEGFFERLVLRKIVLLQKVVWKVFVEGSAEGFCGRLIGRLHNVILSTVCSFTQGFSLQLALTVTRDK